MAFYKTVLTNVVIGSGIKKIETMAFTGNPKLLNVTIHAVEVPELGMRGVFAMNFDSSTQDTCYVPAGCVDAYKADMCWVEAFGSNIVEQ
jgi:hypothetical protein